MTDPWSELQDLTRELQASIVLLLEKRRIRTALMLILASVDILGALESAGGQASRASFLDWADVYIDPPSSLLCESLDLYGARCGMLHAMAAESGLSVQGHAAKIVWLTEPNTLPEPSPDPRTRFVAVGALWVAFRDGVSRFAAELKEDPTRMAVVEKNLGGTYATRLS